jgi:hypothetical protein
MKNKEKKFYSQKEREMILLWNRANSSKKEAWLSFWNRELLSLRHERLIHLLVTLFFGGACLFLSFVSFTIDGWYFPSVLATMLVTTVFYIAHYYKLENECQSRQRIVADLERDFLSGKKGR